jgi:hypothetical protein
VKTDDDKKWLQSFFPAFMLNSQEGGKTWGVPFQRSTIVLYWNKDLFKEAGLDPEKPPATWAEQAAFAEKLTKRDASGNVTQWGIQIPSSGFPYWLFQALATQNGAMLANQEGNQTFFDKPEVVRRSSTGSTSPRTGSTRPASSSGAPRRRIFRAQGRHDVDHHRQPHQCALERQIPVRRRHAAGRASSSAARPAAAISISPRRRPRRSSRRPSASSSGSPRRSAPRSGASTPGYVAVRPDAYDTPP